NEFRILCLPTGFAPYHDQKLDESQDLALKWLLKSSIKLDSKNDSKVVINLKVKGGYGQYFDYYKNLLNHPSVRILDESVSLIELFTKTDLVITTGSTASLEAATCHLPVIQIAPPYLLKKIIFVSGLPLAKTCDELESLMEEAIINSQDFYRRRCCNVKEELADVDPAWDSIKKTSDWLISLVT
ncbi:MAG: hypothetical protein ACE5D6_08760, partial [Candidatus Zixiibacteriota bacterium]